MEVLVKLFYPDAKPPIKKFRGDAGFDLFAYDSYFLKPGDTVRLDCGVGLWIPEGFVGITFPRSSWRAQGILCQSVFDHGFTGRVEPFTTNVSSQALSIPAGERVLQMMLIHAQLGGRIRIVDELPESERGSRGAGSTGKF